MQSVREKDAPQCQAGDAVTTDALHEVDLGDSRGGVIANQKNDEASSGVEDVGLDSLSDDLLMTVFLYCGPADVEGSVKMVNRRFRNATSSSSMLWKEFCIYTGKIVDIEFVTASIHGGQSGPDTGNEDTVDENDSPTATTSANVADSIDYCRHYFHNPCVPVDFSSIQDALDQCAQSTANNSVVIMPGIYDEKISIGGEAWATGGSQTKIIEVRAAFPSVGASIVSKIGGGGKDEPCIAIEACDDGTSLDGAQKTLSVRLSHLKITHSALGANIWAGNSAICVLGPQCQVVVESCVFKSHSGRGVVVSNQAMIEMHRSTIIDCAATGFYLGDWGSSAKISGCNIIRNGFGSAAAATDHLNEEQRLLELGTPTSREDFEVVPPGHSGVYIESSMSFVDNSLVAGNCLTGISVVRGGFVSLSESDITENGSTPILIEDAHDVRDASRLRGITIRGGVVEGPNKNNYTSIRADENEEVKLFRGGVVRDGPSFFHDTPSFFDDNLEITEV